MYSKLASTGKVEVQYRESMLTMPVQRSDKNCLGIILESFFYVEL